MTYSLVGRPEIRSLLDLRGKVVGTDQVRGTISAVAPLERYTDVSFWEASLRY